MRNLNILLSAGLLGGMSVTAAAEATAVSNLTLAAAVEPPEGGWPGGGGPDWF